MNQMEAIERDAQEAAELQTLLSEQFSGCRPAGVGLMGWARAALEEARAMLADGNLMDGL